MMFVRTLMTLTLLCTSLTAHDAFAAAKKPKKSETTTTETTTTVAEPAPAAAGETTAVQTQTQTQTVSDTPTGTDVTTQTRTDTVVQTTVAVTTGGDWDLFGGGINDGDNIVALTFMPTTLNFGATYMHAIAPNIQLGLTVSSSSFYSPVPVIGGAHGVAALSVRIGLLNSDRNSLGLRLDPYIAMGSDGNDRLLLGAGLHAQVGYLRWLFAKRLAVGAALDLNFDVPILQTATFRAPILAGLIAEFHFTDNFGLFASAQPGVYIDLNRIAFAFNTMLGASAHF